MRKKKKAKKLELAKETVVAMEDLTRADGGCSVIGNPPNSDCCTSVGSECFS